MKRYRVSQRYLCEDVAIVTARSREEAIELAETHIADTEPPKAVEIEIVGNVVRHYKTTTVIESHDSPLYFNLG